MISQKIADAFNGQINRELFSSYLYASMSAWFKEQSLNGFADRMSRQCKEEIGHAEKLVEYLIKRGGRVEYQTIAVPDNNWKNIKEVFEKTLAHEKYITGEINNLYNLTEIERDRASQIFLQWYIEEQVEEESNIEEIIRKIEMTSCTSDAIFHLDSILSDNKRK